MHNLNRKYLVVIVGPTAVGKTALGIELAKYYGTEVISADSPQIYREMCIGTAVPSKSELAEVKHHFIQTKSVFDYYNASMYEVEALELIDELFLTHDILVVVGGSTLYIDTLCYGIDDLPTVDPEIREQVINQYKTGGIEYLQEQVKLLDPEHYEKVDIQNPKRLMKAIEVSVMTGRPYSSFLTSTRKERDFTILKVGINMPREDLFERINRRVDEMIVAGLVNEAQGLVRARKTNALQTVGYREIFDYLDGKISLDDAITQIKTNTRRYAKRQLTWFNRDKEMPWFLPTAFENIVQFIGSKL